MYRATLDYRTGLIQLEYQELKSHMRRMDMQMNKNHERRPWLRSARHKLNNFVDRVCTFWVDWSCIGGKFFNLMKHEWKGKIFRIAILSIKIDLLSASTSNKLHNLDDIKTLKQITILLENIWMRFWNYIRTKLHTWLLYWLALQDCFWFLCKWCSHLQRGALMIVYHWGGR